MEGIFILLPQTVLFLATAEQTLDLQTDFKSIWRIFFPLTMQDMMFFKSFLQNAAIFNLIAYNKYNNETKQKAFIQVMMSLLKLYNTHLIATTERLLIQI